MLTMQELLTMIESKKNHLESQLLKLDEDIKKLDGMISGLEMVANHMKQEMESNGEDIQLEQGETEEGAETCSGCTDGTTPCTCSTDSEEPAGDTATCNGC